MTTRRIGSLCVTGTLVLAATARADFTGLGATSATVGIDRCRVC